MPWELEIMTIDVGQGESSLIIARDNAIGGQTRVMLIDGGLAQCAQTVHECIVARLHNYGIARIDHIVVGQYDGDHSRGVMALLVADNLDLMLGIVADSAARNAFGAAGRFPGNVLRQIASATAAASATLLGAYDKVGHLDAVVADAAGNAADALVFAPGTTPAQAAARGLDVGIETAENAMHLNPNLWRKAPRRSTLARAIGIAAGTLAGAVPVRSAAAKTVGFARARTGVSLDSRFLTNGLYRSVSVIDLGDTPHTPDSYANVIAGMIPILGEGAVSIPAVERRRISLAPADLGTEVLWHTGTLAMAAPAGSPAMFLMAVRKYMWRAAPGACPIASGQPNNDDCIGLVLRFGGFFFYTGGDLCSLGEDLIANAIMANQLPNPQGGPAFALPDRFAAIKCGHHGSLHSTSNAFLNIIRPRVALISCGRNQSGIGDNHPAQALIDRLHAHPDVANFYLTNCNYYTLHIPASNGDNQLVPPPAFAPNYSRVCGDSAARNMAVGRQRGNICLNINQVEANAAPGAGRQFTITYFDDDNVAMGPMHVPAVIGLRVEAQLF
jgi:hypothetical protein